jgi:hypothetical protein
MSKTIAQPRPAVARMRRLPGSGHNDLGIFPA